MEHSAQTQTGRARCRRLGTPTWCTLPTPPAKLAQRNLEHLVLQGGGGVEARGAHDTCIDSGRILSPHLRALRCVALRCVLGSYYNEGPCTNVAVLQAGVLPVAGQWPPAFHRPSAHAYQMAPGCTQQRCNPTPGSSTAAVAAAAAAAARAAGATPLPQGTYLGGQGHGHLPHAAHPRLLQVLDPNLCMGAYREARSKAVA